MTLYLLKSSLCLSLLLAAYRLLLEKEKMFRFNRIYLLFSLIFSFIVPFMPRIGFFHTDQLHDRLPAIATGIRQLIGPTPAPEPNVVVVPYPGGLVPVTAILWICYALVTIHFLLRFTRNLYQIHLRARDHQQVNIDGARIVLLPEEIVSHSFYKTIFIHAASYNENRLEKEVLMHEMAHVRQRHTIDILLVEFLRIFLWWNPLVILYKRAIQLNHEFLADESVTLACDNPKEYQYLLLSKISPINHMSLTSPLNYKITKKRLIMITATYNQKSASVKKLAVIALALGALFLFSTNTNAQEEKRDTAEEYPDRTIAGSEYLGAHPYVMINDREYPADILTKISPSCVRATSIVSREQAKLKHGSSGADGEVDITTVKEGISYVTAIERENLVKERAAKKGFYHRLTLRKNDGSSYDKLIVNLPDGRRSIAAWASQGARVAFLIDNKVYGENQIAEVEKIVKDLPVRENGVGGNGVKKIPGVDLSPYELVFYF